MRFNLKILLISFILLSAFSPCAAAADGKILYRPTGEESLAVIAFARGCDAELLAAMNNLSPNSKVTKAIWLPQEPSQTITVQKGDNLWQIAQTYQTSVRALISINDLDDPSFLKVGQTLNVPIANASEPQELYQPIVSVAAKSADTALASRSAGNFSWPAKGVLTSRFGNRSRGFHHGLDIAAAAGSDVTAAASGKVSFAGWHSAVYGNTVMIDHGNNVKTLYAHLKKVSVSVGDSVKQGKLIGLMGATGNATGPHLHFQININDKAVNPQKYLP